MRMKEYGIKAPKLASIPMNQMDCRKSVKLRSVMTYTKSFATGHMMSLMREDNLKKAKLS